jgi:hypothetical protein
MACQVLTATEGTLLLESSARMIVLHVACQAVEKGYQTLP